MRINAQIRKFLIFRLKCTQEEMAFLRPKGTFNERTAIWKIDNNTINSEDVKGRGAYGVVYVGKDKKKNVIAGKEIDGNKHLRILTQNMDRLLELDHEHILKIFDIHRQNKSLWMFIEYCPHGDLNFLQEQGYHDL